MRVVSGLSGSTADITARVVGARMGHILGQQFVIEDRAGAASSLAAAMVARAPKDGSMLYVANADIINAAMSSHLSFDILADFSPIVCSHPRRPCWWCGPGSA